MKRNKILCSYGFLVSILRQVRHAVEGTILPSSVGGQQLGSFVLGAFYRFYG